MGFGCVNEEIVVFDVDARIAVVVVCSPELAADKLLVV